MVEEGAHALDILRQRLRSQDDLPLYQSLLRAELSFLAEAQPDPMTTAQAHGLDPQAGVSPLSPPVSVSAVPSP